MTNLERLQGFVSAIAFDKKLTLATILSALHHRGEEGQCYGASFSHGDFETFWIIGADSVPNVICYWHCKWDLAKNFQGQSEETQRTIATLLGYKEEK